MVLAVKEAERGLRPGVKTRELRIPDDLTIQFIKSNMTYINKIEIRSDILMSGKSNWATVVGGEEYLKQLKLEKQLLQLQFRNLLDAVDRMVVVVVVDEDEDEDEELEVIETIMHQNRLTNQLI